MANNTGLSAMERTISCETRFLVERPRNRSVPFMQSARLPRSSSWREFQLVFGQIRALLVNEPLGIEHADVLALYPERAVEPRTGHARRAGPHHHDGHVFNPAAREFTGVEQGRTGNDAVPC